MDVLEELNREQRRAVTHGGGPLLIVAGAGTGKTTVITKRVAWLIESGQCKPDHILALTFTDKAAGEMEERVDKLLPYGYNDLWVSTFHAFGERLLHQHALDIGVPHDFRILSETEQWLLVRRHLDRFNLAYYRPLGNPTKFIHALVRHFSRAKDEEVYPDDYLRHAEALRLDRDTELKRRVRGKKRGPSSVIVSRASERGRRRPALPAEGPPRGRGGDEAARTEEVANAFHVYQQLLLEENALDFGDLINYTLKLFRTRPEVLDRYRRQFRYLLVDEFQDTNWAQYELVKLLAAPTNNLTVVGDDDQSIYRFRGASMSNILQFRQDYPGAAQVVLAQNYRSTQDILDLAYHFIQHNNPNRLEVQLRTTGLTKALRAVSDEAGVVEHCCGQTAEDEQQLVVEKIIELKAAHPELGWNDFAVLARSNDQAAVFDAALDRAGLPHQSVTSKGLYGKPVVVDALAYLRLLDNYHESPALWRVLGFPFWGLSDRDLVEVSHYASRKSWSLFEALEQSALIPGLGEATRRTFARLLQLMGEHAAFARQHRPTELLVKVLNDIGYTAYVEQLGEVAARAEFSFLNQFYQRVKRWEDTQADPRLREFMEVMRYEVESGEAGSLAVDLEAGPEVIPVMTVHAAKGLEFTYVFVVGLVDRRFPTAERREPIELPAALVKEVVPSGDVHLEEERRLFYVAMTRARRGLFLTSAEDYGGARRKRPSPFLVELGRPLAAPVSVAAARQFVARPVAREVVTVETARRYIPERFSYTQLKAFESCPYQYRYAHVLRVPVWGKWTFSFGKTMHLTLERFFRLIVERRGAAQATLFGGEAPVVLPTLDDLLNLYEGAWIDEWYPSRDDAHRYFERGRTALKAFFEKHDGRWPLTKAVEEGFTLKVGPHSLRGQIDRVDATDGGLEIIDYKTGRVPEREADVDKDQLLIYQLAAEQVWGEAPVALTYYYLEANKAVSFHGTAEQLREVQEKIARTIEAIRRGSFPATPSAQKCRQCDFKSICPFSQA